MPRWYAPAYERDGKLVVSESLASRDLEHIENLVARMNVARAYDWFVGVVNKPEWKRLGDES